jgi:hypothetical protein
MSYQRPPRPPSTGSQTWPVTSLFLFLFWNKGSIRTFKTRAMQAAGVERCTKLDSCGWCRADAATCVFCVFCVFLLSAEAPSSRAVPYYVKEGTTPSPVWELDTGHCVDGKHVCMLLWTAVSCTCGAMEEENTRQPTCAR